MSKRELEQAELLDLYLTHEVRGGAGEVPEGLDLGLVQLVQRLEHHLRPSDAEPGFVEQLRHRIESQATSSCDAQGKSRLSTWAALLGNAPRHRWLMAGMASAVALLVVLSGVFLWVAQPQPVNAQAILERAAQVTEDPDAWGVRSLEVTSTYRAKRVEPRFGPVGTEMRSETHLWWQAPNLWRREFRQIAPADEIASRPNISVSDGHSVWDSAAGGEEVTVNGWEPQRDVLQGLSALGDLKGMQADEAKSDLSSLLHDLRVCYNPQLLREESLVERLSYVIDLGPTKCPSASAASMNGRRIIWVDKETFFELKREQYGVEPDQGLIALREITSIRFNGDLDPQLFTFTPPPGAAVHDFRPKPAPSEAMYLEQLAKVAGQADFPIFVPQRIPGGLQPRQPKIDPTEGVKLAYVSTGEADKSSLASQHGIEITERRATYDLVARWTERLEVVDIAGVKGWLRRGVRDVKGASDSAALILRDGTLLSVNSFVVPPEELIKLAASLSPVPGGHAPLPNPRAPSMEEIRQRASFKVFLPGYTPPGLKPEPPIPGQQQGRDRIDAATIVFHSPDGAVALRLVEGPPREPSSMAGPMLTAPEVAIKDGLSGRLMNAPSVQTRLLWWEQEGTYISLETRVLSKEELLRVAASMSATADLGQVEPPASRPTPTPVPAPRFNILRPSWLPEPMTIREQYETGLAESGSWALLAFDPRPDDKQPHNMLMLRERPGGSAGRGGNPDPQASEEQVGERAVTVIRRGESCITLSWEQGGISLALTNPYDPPGHPRYSCDDLRKVVESIR